MARPENRSEARALSLTLPTETFNYLALLATLGKLGRTENEVATHILVREVYAMVERRFHEMRIPPPSERAAGEETCWCGARLESREKVPLTVHVT